MRPRLILALDIALLASSRETMRILLGLLLIILASVPLVAQTRDDLQSQPFVFTHVTVIDATGATAKPDMTVVIIGDRIATLGKSGKVRVPANAQVVDATGKYLIPGLWDMHVHVFRHAPKDRQTNTTFRCSSPTG